jgi:glutamate dehydrogenase/leucine dehydrogenase
MVEFLVGEGATVLVSDIDPAKVAAMVGAHGATAIDAADVDGADVDVYCPCALGATINDESLAVLKAPIVCGSANNQLAEWRHGDELHRRGVLYAPDYIANAGGTVSTPTGCGAASTRNAVRPRSRRSTNACTRSSRSARPTASRRMRPLTSLPRRDQRLQGHQARTADQASVTI